MYKQNPVQKTTIEIDETYIGETIEKKVYRILNNKEPIKDGAPIIYTDRKEGVNPFHNIKTDRFELACEAHDYITKTRLAKREVQIGERTYDTMSEAEQKAFNEKYPKNRHNKQNGETPVNTSDSTK